MKKWFDDWKTSDTVTPAIMQRFYNAKNHGGEITRRDAATIAKAIYQSNFDKSFDKCYQYSKDLLIGITEGGFPSTMVAEAMDAVHHELFEAMDKIIIGCGKGAIKGQWFYETRPSGGKGWQIMPYLRELISDKEFMVKTINLFHTLITRIDFK